MRDGVHVPVLLDAAVSALVQRAEGVYVDGTFGRGGHARAILARLAPGGRLVALDRDPAAEHAARGIDDPRFAFRRAWFSEAPSVLDAMGIDRIDGALLDLGTSSPQLDDAQRGFSLRFDGPLDMRMDPTRGMSASEWLQQASEGEITQVVRDYGQERFAVQIAKAIVARSGDASRPPIQTTGELARIVAGVVRSRQGRAQMGKDPATRTFQAVRIFINQELEELARALAVAVERLRVRGRLAVISFHSLEDRIVKQVIAREAGRDAPRDPVRGGPAPGTRVRLRPVARVLPGAAELVSNPRARSAVLRVAERVEAAVSGARDAPAAHGGTR
ncbi:MAG: 16S rRNA (cytosine(1402)-N(4))-methyltransferase RsmH [Burkholderiales bacterium]|nr:16S rRNA (cytosine(1402)-N(4))-methyltransferase RsmH [Burkholderiales bacterium]